MKFLQRCLYRAEELDGNIRSLFRGEGFIRAVEEAMKRESVSRISLFADGSRLFLYYECHGVEILPENLMPAANPSLAVWPGGGTERRWTAMTDIFHYQAPASEQHWERKNEDSVPYGRIARLKPEETASYVYYHYQYQEERPGDGDKYGIIGLHENLLFFYSELPSTIEPAPYKGKLNTSLRPDDWAAVMDPHFMKWEEAPSGQEIWRELELIREVRISAERQGTNHA